MGTEAERGVAMECPFSVEPGPTDYGAGPWCRQYNDFCALVEECRSYDSTLDDEVEDNLMGGGTDE